jgi:N-acetylneuraminate synthase
MNEFSISGRQIGYEHPPLVVAEIGINHNGSLETAIKMVDSAVKAGVEVIKHQTHIIDDEMSPAAKKVIPGNSNKSIYEIMEDCALSELEEYELKRYVESKGKIFISTPFSRAAAIRLEKMNIEAYKIGSGECNNYPLIQHIAELGKPVILSTGMNDLKSISKSVNILRRNNIPYALLHTTNIYPTPHHLVRLESIRELQKTFEDAVVGLSDHTLSNHACFGAVALGASILERHFTDSMSREGPDIVCSMDGKAAEELIEGVNIIYKERGGKKGPVEEEKPTINFAFATVVSIKDIKKGETFSKENIWVKRPGSGSILAEEFENILGKKAKKDISKDIHLNFDDIVEI